MVTIKKNNFTKEDTLERQLLILIFVLFASTAAPRLLTRQDYQFSRKVLEKKIQQTVLSNSFPEV